MNPLEAYQQFNDYQANKGLFRALPQTSHAYEIDFTRNDSLGLAQHPAVLESAQSHLRRFGASLSGARLLCKHQDIFANIEQKIAALKQTQTALLFSSGFVTNCSVISALLNKRVLKCDPLVFTDKLIHASLHQGIKLAGAKQIRFRHQDLNHLEQRLQTFAQDSRPKFIFIESLYGMQGTLSDLKAFAHLAQKHQAFLYVDEAHAFGLYGPKGGGFSASVQGVNISMGNFSKALGSFGGFVACSNTLKEYLLNSAQGFIYSTALPPCILGAQAAALDLIPTMDSERDKLHRLSAYMRQALCSLNLNLTSSKSHIFGVTFKDVSSAKKAHQILNNARLATSFIRPPTAPEPMLRISLNTSHTFEQVDVLLEHLKQIHAQTNLLESC